MGNCLLPQQKPVSVMKTDGKIIEYKAPIKVHELLSEFPHHAISDKLPVAEHLHPDADMLGGDHLYYLLPLPRQPTKKPKKTVRFAEDLEEERDKETSSGVVRIKVVISKKELQAMLSEGGVSVEDMVSRMQKAPNKIGSIAALESIPQLPG